jgi:rubrerythrin
MENQYSGVEVVEMGVVIEQNGRDFYNALSERSENKAAQLAFEYLAQEEEKHIRYFENILNQVQKSLDTEGSDSELYSYLTALASEHVFSEKNTGQEMARKVDNATDAINMGIRFEKESIQLFEKMREIVPDESKPIVQTLIEEEERHLQKLLDLKETVK